MPIARAEAFHSLLDTRVSKFPHHIIEQYISLNESNPYCVTEDDLLALDAMGLNGNKLGPMILEIGKEITVVFDLIKSLSNNRNILAEVFGGSVEEMCRVTVELLKEPPLPDNMAYIDALTEEDMRIIEEINQGFDNSVPSGNPATYNDIEQLAFEEIYKGRSS